METLRCVQGYRRKNGHFRHQDQNLVCIYFLPHNGVAADRLFCSRFLDEYEEVYHVGEEKPSLVPVIIVRREA